MIVLRDSSALPATCTHAVMALGNFDGLHLGHRAILQETVRLAAQQGRSAGVMTFEPHPRRVFKPELPPLRIFTFSEKVKLLAGLGIRFIRVVRFTREFAKTPAQDFITQVLHQQMQVAHVVTGEDFTFGHNRTGTQEFLREQATKLGFATTACAPVLLGGERCSSTRVRSLLSEGKMREAAGLLDRPYNITGIVQQGDKRGRTLGFPTANILPTRIFLPASGVYAVRAQVEGEKLNGVANLGSRPTVGGTQMRLEVHLLDWQGDLYGKKLEVEFIDRIRNERKFAGLDELKAQIAEDSMRAKELL